MFFIIPTSFPVLCKIVCWSSNLPSNVIRFYLLHCLLTLNHLNHKRTICLKSATYVARYVTSPVQALLTFMISPFVLFGLIQYLIITFSSLFLVYCCYFGNQDYRYHRLRDLSQLFVMIYSRKFCEDTLWTNCIAN